MKKPDKNNKKHTNNISLIGFMGSGKSTVGKILARRLKFLFIDLDRVIELSEDMSIFEIFNKYGEKYFRDVESEVISKIFKNTRCVFSCGGGVILREENMNCINNNSFSIYLSITPENAYKRLCSAGDRPLLGKEDRKKTIHDLLKSREELYRKYSKAIVDVNNRSPEEAVNEIIKIFLKKNHENHKCKDISKKL